MSEAELSGLDAALDAQKKKQKHRVYSQRAILHDPNLTVPTGPSEEEQRLDEVLRKKDAELDQAAITRPQVAPPRMVVPRTEQEQNRNWLLPEAEEENVSPDAEEDNWLVQELTRQHDIQREQMSLKEEDALVRQKLREEQRMQSLEINRLQQPGLSPNPLLGRGAEQERSSSGLLAPLSIQSSSRRENPLTGISPFAVNQPKKQSGVVKNPFDLETIRQRSPVAPKKKSPFDLSDQWGTSQKKPLSPLQNIKKSSPIHRKNPFDDDPMPAFKHSIWD